MIVIRGHVCKDYLIRKGLAKAVRVCIINGSVTELLLSHKSMEGFDENPVEFLRILL